VREQVERLEDEADPVQRRALGGDVRGRDRLIAPRDGVCHAWSGRCGRGERAGGLQLRHRGLRPEHGGVHGVAGGDGVDARLRHLGSRRRPSRLVDRIQGLQVGVAGCCRRRLHGAQLVDLRVGRTERVPSAP
jgi:hypothetical protein